MAILIEAISVVFRKKSIEEKFPGGWVSFLEDAPNRTLFSDGDIGCISFMHPQDVENYVFYLESFGLDFIIDDHTKDIAVIDQIRGFTIPSPWLRFGKVNKDGNTVSACWLATTQPDFVFTRRDWKFEGSLSKNSGFISTDDLKEHVRFLRHEDGLDVYLNLKTGKEVFMGRPSIGSESKQEVFEKLQIICTEALSLEREGDVARQNNDIEKGAIIYSRLVEGLLPEVEEVLIGPGQKFAFAHFTKGLILRILKELSSAEASFRKANELQPDISNTLLELVRCLGEQDKHEEALPFACRAAELEPNNQSCLGNLAMTLFLTGKKDEARLHIERALEIDPHDPINKLIYSNFK